MDYNALSEMIYKRLSVRKYEKEPLGEDLKAEVMSAIAGVKPLYPDIKTSLCFFERDEIRSLMPWMPEDAIGIYSETKDGYLENAGFILEQVDLYLQSIGLGACWVGLAGPKERKTDGESEFVILLAIGKSKVELRSGESDFNRKALGEIASAEGEAMELLRPVRLAPSSVNSQPWYFVFRDGEIDVYRRELVRTKGLRRMNRIDVGIALSYLFVLHPESFSAAPREDAAEIDGMIYVTTVKI